MLNTQKSSLKILVTGGAGFIGSALLRYIINDTNYSVVNIDKLTYAGNLQSLKSISKSSRYIFEQVDTSIQWPFTPKLNGVARINYSLQDDEMLAGLAGFEYRSCCWSLRLVAQRFTTSTRRTSTAVFVQLELNGLMQIGTDPLRALQNGIPGYSRIN